MSIPKCPKCEENCVSFDGTYYCHCGTYSTKPGHAFEVSREDLRKIWRRSQKDPIEKFWRALPEDVSLLGPDDIINVLEFCGLSLVDREKPFPWLEKESSTQKSSE